MFFFSQSTGARIPLGRCLPTLSKIYHSWDEITRFRVNFSLVPFDVNRCIQVFPVVEQPNDSQFQGPWNVCAVLPKFQRGAVRLKEDLHMTWKINEKSSKTVARQKAGLMILRRFQQVRIRFLLCFSP